MPGNKVSYPDGMTRHQWYKSKDLCPDCGKPAADGRTRCQFHLDLRNAYRKEGAKERANRRICTLCWSRPVEKVGARICGPCRSTGRERDRVKQSEVINNGGCRSCRRSDVEIVTSKKTKLCISCYVRRCATQRLGSSFYWKDLIRKLEDQNYRCPYTGILLKPGDNMSLDHILPTSRFPDLAGSIDNVEWVLDRVNLMKGNLTKEEFLQAVELIREVNTCK